MNYGQINQQAINEAWAKNMQYEKGKGLGFVESASIEKHDPKASNRAIPQAFSNLEKDLYVLGERLNELNNRLKPVSRHESPQVEKGLAAGQDALIAVPMVSAIAQADRSLRMSLHLLGDIIERLEV
jgi:hypothetical protein